ncbi:hypothetical protein [Methylomicrobium album]|uniref:Uncharacterized protein n=1 Tax=Methylomicrobium album BG8 TaxID=686340 RepID=H8GHJ8_METAL|nr:hypothetical protein [Methylomicrobium album]EIC30150.1 hypothetical protein Metal_2428 [Methylomicrobium album BG8]
MIEQLVEIANGYHGSDYHVYGEIPQRKLVASTSFHGVDPRDTVIVLLDSTVMGSAENGMSITLKGVYWKNMWAVKTRKNSYTWEELRHIYKGIEIQSGHLVFEPGVEFSFPANYNGISLLNLIKTLTQFFIETTQMTNLEATGTTYQHQAENMPSTEQNVVLIGDNSAKIYIEIVPELIALCVAADGEVEDSEIELATAIIENDDLIQDKQLALESLSTNLDKLISDKKKSNAIFKLKSTTIISKVSKISDSLQKERLEVILDGMLESVCDEGSSDTKSIVDAIKKKL